MKCMRCGTAITSSNVFCETCLEDMKRHPIDPSTPIQLPKRDDAPPEKKHYRKPRKPEETVVYQRGVILWLILILLAVSISLGMVLSMWIPTLQEPTEPETPAAYHAEMDRCFT